jgi:hypothetical protein
MGENGINESTALLAWRAEDGEKAWPYSLWEELRDVRGNTRVASYVAELFFQLRHGPSHRGHIWGFIVLEDCFP